MSEARPTGQLTQPQVGGTTATVLIGQRIRPGRRDAHRVWQDRLNAAAATFEGYLGMEETTADSEATILYRFDSVEHLSAWLGSPTRAELVGGGDDIFEGPETQQVLVGDGNPEALMTVVVTHQVAPSDEDAFLDWQARMSEAEGRYPGFRGSELFRPVAGIQDDWTAVYRYESAADAEAWLNSPARKTLLEEGKRFDAFQLRKVSNSFSSWFSFDDGDGPAGPPSWKAALSVLVGLYPTVVVLTVIISELWKSAELWQSLLLGNVLSVSLLTWVIMPIVNRALRFWLTPGRGARQPRTDQLGLLASVAFLFVAAVVFWLVTVQIWTLP